MQQTEGWLTRNKKKSTPRTPKKKTKRNEPIRDENVEYTPLDDATDQLFQNIDWNTVEWALTKQEEEEILNFKEEPCAAINELTTIDKKPSIDIESVQSLINSLENKMKPKQQFSIVQSLAETGHHYLSKVIHNQREEYQINVRLNEEWKKAVETEYEKKLHELQQFYFQQFAKIKADKIVADSLHMSKLNGLDTEKTLIRERQRIIDFMKFLISHGNQQYVVVLSKDKLDSYIDQISWTEGRFSSPLIPSGTELHNALNSIYGPVLKHFQYRRATLFVRCVRSIPIINNNNIEKMGSYTLMPNTSFYWDSGEYHFDIDAMRHQLTNCIFWNQPLFYAEAARILTAIGMKPESPVGVAHTYVKLDVSLYSHTYQ